MEVRGESSSCEGLPCDSELDLKLVSGEEFDVCEYKPCETATYCNEVSYVGELVA